MHALLVTSFDEKCYIQYWPSEEHMSTEVNLSVETPNFNVYKNVFLHIVTSELSGFKNYYNIIKDNTVCIYAMPQLVKQNAYIN